MASSTLEIQMQLNKLLEDSSKIIEKMNGQYSSQVKLVEGIAAANKKALESFKAMDGSKLTDSLKDASEEAGKVGNEMDEAMKKAASEINSTTKETKSLSESFDQTSKEMEKLNVGVSIIGGIGKAISFVANAGVSALQMMQGIGGGIFEIAKSVLAFPFKMLDGLISMASVGGSNELAQELENIRKQFGYLNKTAGATIISLAKSMKGELANTGLSTFRVFGNLVERLQYFREYAEKLGETVDAVFRNLKASSAEALGAFNKGLGFTDAGLKGVAQVALASGKDINEVNREIANYAIQLSSSFGVSMKLVSRDVGELMADFEHFGHLAVKELSQIAVYARRLGIEAKSLGKLVDKFMNFEDSAESAARLSQAFGLNIDAFKMMKEQDPGKKLDMLRQSFFAAGKSVERMTAAELRYLAQNTSLSEAEVKLAFAQKNRALSYDDVRKKGDAAKKSQLTQEQALSKLAGAIERLVKSGSAMQGGFFDRFIQGFVSGIRMSKEFRELMRNLQRSLAIVFYEGRRVGLMFVEMFPGVKDFFGGLRDMFNPGVMRRFMRKVGDAFRDFFSMMTTNPTTALPKLLEKLQDAFTERFSSSGGGARKVFEGIQKFFKAVGFIFLSGIKEAILGLGKVIAPMITRIFSPETFSTASSEIGETASSLGQTLTRMFESVFGAEGSPTRQKLVASLETFWNAIKTALFSIASKTFSQMPDMFKMISDGLNAASKKGDGKASKIGMTAGEKFFVGLGESFEKSRPFIENIMNKLGDMLGPIVGNMIGKLTSKLLRTFTEGFFHITVSFPAMLIGIIGTFIEKIPTVMLGMIGRMTQGLDSMFGRDSFLSKMFRGMTFPLTLFLATLKSVFNFAVSFLMNIGTVIEDFFNKGPRAAFSNFITSMGQAFDRAKVPVIQALNRLISALPQRVQSFFGLSTIPLPVVNPADNPIVQTIAQGVEASRTGGSQIQDYLSAAVAMPAQIASPSIRTDSSLSDRVSEIRSTINSATEIGRIDQAKADQSMQNLQAFAGRLGPTMAATQTALTNAFRNIDLNKISETVNNIKEVFDAVSSIRRTVASRAKAISVSDLMPLGNSIDALTVFTTSPMMARLATSLSNTANTARISGIQNTSEAIKEMVTTINATSKELARIEPIRIQANLERLAHNLGLGNNAAYTIKNENFTVNVEVKVHLDAKELEKVLVERPDTRIRHT